MTRLPIALSRCSTLTLNLLDREVVRHAPEDAAREQLERRVRRFVGIARRLALLHLVEEARDARVVLVGRDADAREFREYVRLAGLLGDEQLRWLPTLSGVTCS